MSIDLSGKRRRATLTALALVLGALFAASALPAAADTPNRTVDPMTQIDHVDVSYGRVVPAASKDVSPPPPKVGAGRTSAAAVRCWTLDVTRKGKNIFGGTLITFKTHTGWCGDGSWIRGRASTTSSHSQAFGWAYEGLVRNYDQYGIDWNQFHSVREAQFCLLNCVAQSKYLTNDISVGPNGQVYHT